MPEESLERYSVGRLLGYSITPSTMDVPVIPRGYRILRQIPRLPNLVVENIVIHFKNVSHIYSATSAELDEVDGVGGARAKAIREGINAWQGDACCVVPTSLLTGERESATTCTEGCCS